MISDDLKKYIANTIMSSPSGVKTLCERHSTKQIPGGYLDKRLWARVSKHVIKNQQEELTKLPFEAITDTVQYGTVLAPIVYPVVLRCFVINTEKFNGLPQDMPDDTQIWIITDSTDSNVLGWSMESD